MSEPTNREVYLGAYGITYAYGGKRVLDEVSFEIPAGEIVALLGPNGSGKSTLLKLLSGVIGCFGKDQSATVRLKGKDFLSLPGKARARQMVYVGSDLGFHFPITAYESVTLGRICHSVGNGGIAPTPENAQMIRHAMESTFCWELRHRELQSLSGGERQLVAFARALAQGAKILLLDEALSKMDLNHQAAMGSLIKNLTKNEGYTVILVSHDVNLACSWANLAILLKAGQKIASGPIREVLTLENLKQLYPKTAITLGAHPVGGAPQIFLGA